MIFSESNAKIAAALAKSWGEIQNPKHNKTVKVQTKSGGNYTFDYTDLSGIFDEAKRVYKENGIAVLQNASTSETDGRLILSVETMLLHTSGEWVKSGPLKMAANPSIQDMGGQITYMKRYSLSAMLGIATEEDDDANGASGNEFQFKKGKTDDHDTSSHAQNKPPISAKQLGLIKVKVEELVSLGGEREAILTSLKVKVGEFGELADLDVGQASKAIETLTGWVDKKKAQKEAAHA